MSTADLFNRTNYARVRLIDICSLVTERVPIGSPARLRVDLEHIEPHTGLLTNEALSATPEGTRTGFQRDDILFGKLRPYLRKTHLATEDGECSTEIWVLRPRVELVNPRYLHCVLRSQALQRLASATAGTKMPRADWEHVSEAPIALPPKATQVQIADADLALERTGRLLAQSIAAKRDQKRGLMQQLLTGKVRFPGFTEPWKTVRLGEIAHLRGSKGTSSHLPHLRCIELEHIESGTGEIIGEASVGSTVSLKTEFAPGDVLFGKLRPYLRKFALVEFAGLCSTEIWALIPDQTVITSGYLRLLVEAPAVQRAANATSGTKMPRADWDVVSTTPVHLPPKSEQDRITLLASAIDSEIRLLSAQRQALATQRRGLMERLLSGEIDIPSSDTSAA